MVTVMLAWESEVILCNLQVFVHVCSWKGCCLKISAVFCKTHLLMIRNEVEVFVFNNYIKKQRFVQFVDTY